MAKDFSKMFCPGGLVGTNLIKRGAQARTDKKFIAPAKLLLDGYCTPVENQKGTPYCAAYAASSYAESILWRKRNYPEEIPVKPIYDEAKKIDGLPLLQGTSLEAAMQALLNLGYFDKDKCKVKLFFGEAMGRTDGLQSVKFAVHTYGCCVAGFNITDSWYKPSFFGNTINLRKKDTKLGLHAVLITGYEKDRVRIFNSWGKSYGEDGFVWISNEAFNDQFAMGAVITNSL